MNENPINLRKLKQYPREVLDRDIVQQYLASRLVEGSLGLMLGAGISSGLGLPMWCELVNRCRNVNGVQPDDTSFNTSTPALDLRIAMDSIEEKLQKDQYYDLVRSGLYEHVGSETEVMKHDLLIALGAMMMGSERGNVQEVMTFNYDDILEWYLRLHGFGSTVVVKFPWIRRAADVTIFHPHGFLPRNNDIFEDSPDLIFSEASYNRRGAKQPSPWKRTFLDFLTTKSVLVIGLKGHAEPLLPLALWDAKEVLNDSRYTGVWLFGSNKSSEDLNYYWQRNFVPLCLDGYEDIPKFILETCQISARQWGSGLL